MPIVIDRKTGGITSSQKMLPQQMLLPNLREGLSTVTLAI
jgi:hypothetical protein